MLLPMARHMPLKTAVLPVKWIPARSEWERATSDTAAASPGMKLTTPGGSPASSRSFMR